MWRPFEPSRGGPPRLVGVISLVVSFFQFSQALAVPIPKCDLTGLHLRYKRGVVGDAGVSAEVDTSLRLEPLQNSKANHPSLASESSFLGPPHFGLPQAGGPSNEIQDHPWLKGRYPAGGNFGDVRLTTVGTSLSPVSDLGKRRGASTHHFEHNLPLIPETSHGYTSNPRAERLKELQEIHPTKRVKVIMPPAQLQPFQVHSLQHQPSRNIKPAEIWPTQQEAQVTSSSQAFLPHQQTASRPTQQKIYIQPSTHLRAPRLYQAPTPVPKNTPVAYQKVQNIHPSTFRQVPSKLGGEANFRASGSLSNKQTPINQHIRQEEVRHLKDPQIPDPQFTSNYIRSMSLQTTYHGQDITAFIGEKNLHSRMRRFLELRVSSSARKALLKDIAISFGHFLDWLIKLPKAQFEVLKKTKSVREKVDDLWSYIGIADELLERGNLHLSTITSIKKELSLLQALQSAS